MPTETTAELETLDRTECLQRLAETQVGRLAVNLRSEVPTIRPVNYLFDGRTESIVFRTGDGAKFRGLALSGRATFEIDGYDQDGHTGWSVIVVGSTERITDPFEIRRLERTPPAWAPGEKPHWMRIRIATVSGRRIGPQTT